MKKNKAFFLPEKNISKNAWIYSLGTYSSKIISLIIFPIIAVELGFEDTGKYDLVISTVAILGPIFSLQIGDAAYRWLSESSEKQKCIGFTISTLVLFAMVILLSITALFVRLIQPIPFLFIGYLILVSHMLLNTMMQILRGNGQIKLYTSAMIVRSVAFALGELWAVFYSENKLQNVLIAFAAANFLSLLICLSKGFKREQFSLQEANKINFKRVLNYAYPMVFNALSWVLLINVNKYIISSRLDYEMNGIFAVAEKLASPIFFLGIFYFFSAQDHYLSKANFQYLSKDFKQLIKKISLLTGLGVIALITGAYLLLPVFFPELEKSIVYLPLLTLANLVMIISIYLSIPYTYQKESLQQAVSTVVGILTTILLSLILIDYWGLTGVCIAILVGTLLTLTIRVRRNKVFFQGVKS